jgi:tetratricopeptide (TPR) repeat protein
MDIIPGSGDAHIDSPGRATAGAARPDGNGTAQNGSVAAAALLEQARAAHHQGKHEAALELLARALAADPNNADVCWQRGTNLLALGRPDEAIDEFREAIRLRPESVSFRNDAGVVLARLGRREEAAAYYREAIRLQPDFPDAQNNLGNTLRRDGRLDEAVAAYREAIRLRPGYPEAYNNLGVALRGQGKTADAIAAFHEALRLRPAYPEAHHNLGLALASQGRHDAAVGCFQQAIQLRPNDAESYLHLGGALLALNRHDEAVVAISEAIRQQPTNARAYRSLGSVYGRQNKLDDAIRCYQEAIRLRPDYADAHNELGIALAGQNKFDEAAESYRTAIAHRPDYAAPHNNLATVLRNLGRYAEAVAACDRAIELKPNYVEALINRGNALAAMARYAEAIASYTRCLELWPQHVDARLNRALAWLRQGNFVLGWAEFGSRLRKVRVSKHSQLRPAWNGCPPRGLRVLLIAEQGLGDSLQFIRYAPILKRMGATVLFECPEPLVKLLERMPGIDVLFPQGAEPPPHDVHAALMSLPGLLGTRLETIPADLPYIHADAERVERWGRELAAYPELKVGINWQGNPGFPGDFHRSMPLRQFAALARVPGVRLFSLQKYAGSEQLRELGDAFSVVDLGSRLDEGDGTGPFLDTAAVLKNLDLFVSSDTAVVHLAGALGVPVWVPLSASASWQWMDQREDSPWYPTMRLFRQERLLDWPPVFERMAAALRGLVGPTRSVRSVRIDVAPGELIDKLTMLEIKAERVTDPRKLAHVRHEQERLTAAGDAAIIASEELLTLRTELRAVNEKLWEIEEAIRDCDRRGDFGDSFVALARSVYRTNDRRAALKQRINELLNSELVDEQENLGVFHTPYPGVSISERVL